MGLWCFSAGTGFVVRWVMAFGVLGFCLICAFVLCGGYLYLFVFSVWKSKVGCKKKKLFHCFVLNGNILTFVCAIETMMQTSYYITQMRGEKQMTSGIVVCLVNN